MAHRLDGVRAKLKRSAKHLRELSAKVGAFYRSKPDRIVLEADDDPAYLGWYLGIFRIAHQPPIELGVIAGEVFGLYRSALDHLMTQLTALTGTRSGHFPIYPKGGFWLPDGKLRTPKERIADLIRPEHLAIIERLQQPKDKAPRAPASTTALLITQWFSNLDKHELVRPGFLVAKRVSVSYEDNISGFDFLWEPSHSLDDGTHLYRVRFVTEQDMEVPFWLGPELTFGESPYPWLPVERIGRIGVSIRRIVQRFVEITPEFR